MNLIQNSRHNNSDPKRNVITSLNGNIISLKSNSITFPSGWGKKKETHNNRWVIKRKQVQITPSIRWRLHQESKYAERHTDLSVSTLTANTKDNNETSLQQKVFMDRNSNCTPNIGNSHLTSHCENFTNTMNNNSNKGLCKLGIGNDLVGNSLLTSLDDGKFSNAKFEKKGCKKSLKMKDRVGNSLTTSHKDRNSPSFPDVDHNCHEKSNH